MSNQIRVGFIGAGANTRSRHLPGFQEIDDVVCSVVCNRSRESSEKVAKEFNIPRIAETWQEVVNDPEIDAICIGTWPYLHAEITNAALAANKHVLTEARMARDLAEAESMLAASQAKPDLVAQIVPGPMTFEFDATITELIANGDIGELRELCVTDTGCQFALSDAPIMWRQDFELSGRNIMGMGIYHEIIHRWINDEPVWVIADAAIFTTERDDLEKKEKVSVKIPDCISILGRYSSGARMIYQFSGIESGQSRVEIRLNGSKASLRLDLKENALYRADVGSGEEERIDIPSDKKGSWQVEADFIDSIRNGTPVKLTNFELGVIYMRFTNAVYKSWSSQSEKITL